MIWAGVPTRREKVDHEPSSPSLSDQVSIRSRSKDIVIFAHQYSLGVTTNGAGSVTATEKDSMQVSHASMAATGKAHCMIGNDRPSLRHDRRVPVSVLKDGLQDSQARSRNPKLRCPYSRCVSERYSAAHGHSWGFSSRRAVDMLSRTIERRREGARRAAEQLETSDDKDLE